MKPTLQTETDPTTAKIYRTLARLAIDPTWATDRQKRLLDDVSDPLVAMARDTIIAGPGAIIAVSEPALASLIHEITHNHAPSATATKKRLNNKTAGDMARELWPDAVMVIDFSPGTGKFPYKPRDHTCKAKGDHGSVITIRMNETTVTPMITPAWRDTDKRPGCRVCYYERVIRQCKQILFEINRLGDLVLLELATKDAYNRFTGNARQKRNRNGIDAVYRTFPQDDGRYFVVCQQELTKIGKPVSTEKNELFYLIHGLAHTPEDKRISSSMGWGGPWQGTKGDGRTKYAEQIGIDVRPAVQLWTNSSIYDLAEVLGVELIKPFDKLFTVQKSAVDVYECLSLAGIEMHEKTTNRDGLTAFMEFVTDKGQGGNDKKPLSLMRDKANKEEALGVASPTQSGIFDPDAGGNP